VTWQPKVLTRAQLEERRLEGARLLREGVLTKVAIAKALGVTRGTVHVWAIALRKGGIESLAARKAPGNSRKLTPKQERKLVQLLMRGAIANGFDTERWTLKRVRELIQQRFEIDYSISSADRVLKRLGWSAQQPATQAAERDEELVRAWLSKDWDRIKKSASQAAKHHISR
jgi:transposase